jgi:LmbE family N-acetylglucosaminyl deacetylase
MRAVETRVRPSKYEERISLLLDQKRSRVDAFDIGIGFAHPDDETIGCGAQLARWSGACLVLVTDGAPRNLIDARVAGFSTAAEYANARLRELETALRAAGVPSDALVPFGIPDQQAARRLIKLTNRLVKTIELRGLDIIFTHAYEGGHPDHDAVAFAVHAAARLLESRGHPLTVVEMPYYKYGDNGMDRQQFTPGPNAKEFIIHLTPDQQTLKSQMVSAHRTQRTTLEPFDLSTERFRIAPAYDFSELPSGGRLLYDRYDWGLTGREWLALARSALAELGLDKRPC